jgi:hypothetical protein
MKTEHRPAFRVWHIHVVMWSLAVIAATLVGMLIFILYTSVTPYRIPGSIAEAVEPRILSGEDTEVLSYCDRHLAYHPDDIQVRWYRAVAMHRLGQNAEATKELRQISGVDTNWSEYIKTYVEWLRGDDRWTLGTQQTDAEVQSEGAPSD